MIRGEIVLWGLLLAPPAVFILAKVWGLNASWFWLIGAVVLGFALAAAWAFYEIYFGQRGV